MIGFSNSAFAGKSGRQSGLVYGSYSGTQVSSLLTLVSGEHKASARVLRDDWNTPGTTLTLRVYKCVGGIRGPLVSEGTVDSGPTTVKGVSEPNPMLPMHVGPAIGDGDFEIEVVTSGALRYEAAAEV